MRTCSNEQDKRANIQKRGNGGLEGCGKCRQECRVNISRFLAAHPGPHASQHVFISLHTAVGLIIHACRCQRLERNFSSQHSVKQYARGPNISCCSIDGAIFVEDAGCT